MADTQQVTEQVVTETGKTGFGFGQLGKATPMWATWAFRVFLYASALTTVIVTTDNSIPPSLALGIAKYLGYSVMAVHGLSKMVGVDISKDAEDAGKAFNK